jgi:beta-glucanase (GH16 family)
VRRGGLAALVLCLASVGLAACGSAEGASRSLVWSDEFNGDNGAVPDPDKWILEQYAPTETEQQCYTASPDNAHMDGQGHLVISALDQPGTCADGQYRPVTSARLTTRYLHDFEHARFEIRARMPSGEGTWPAFWALSDHRGVAWPESGEIDVLEYVGREPDHVFGTVHFADEDGEHHFVQADDRAEEEGSLHEELHTYAVEWDEDEVTWYLDDEEFGRVTREEVEEIGTWPFDRPYYLLLNLAMGGVLGGDVPEDLAYPQELVVDWIRVYA